MKFDKIFVFGDSFVDNLRLNTFKRGIRDDETHRVNQLELPKLWTEKIKRELNPNNFYNFGKIARGPNHTIDLIKKQKFKKEDLLIVVLSFHDICYDSMETLYLENLKNQNFIHSIDCTTLVFHGHYNEILFHKYTFPLSLIEISFNEILSSREKIYERRWDKRINHLSWENHEILYNCVIKMIKGENNFYYDDFEFKFLDLDDAYHDELTEESKRKEFLYE